MNVFTRLFVVIFLLINSGAGFAAQGFWQDVTTSSKSSSDEVTSIRYFDSDEQALRDFLALVPHESSGDNSYTILLPMPDGTQSSYSIVESPIMETGLAAKYPDIKSYLVYGIDDPGASGRVDISPKGFRGMIYTSQGRVFIDPDWQNSVAQQYLSRSSHGQSSDSGFQCSANQLVSNQMSSPVLSQRTANRIAGSLLEYRLAVSATQEYVLAPNVNTNGTGNELSDALAEINTAINRVNLIYQRDLGIKLVLVANNDLVIDINGDSILDGLDSDGFPLNNNGFEMLSVNQSWVDTQIGSLDYDIGHVFTTGGGGVASISSVCGLFKAEGVTGLPNPVGDNFYIDFVAHEIGHQFGAEHTFNGTTGNCGFGNRSLLPNTFEPGSGSTIMAYAGICGTENIQSSSDATFHAGSIEQINSFVTGAGNCGVGSLISPSNADPTAVAGGNQVIPISTSFLLQGSGSDGDGDSIDFQWDQMDFGTATTSATIGDDLGDNALFRSYLPQSTGNRDFPALGTQVRDGPFDQSEALPCTARNLNFRLTVRDGKSGQATDDLQITVDSNSGPFRITSHNFGEIISTNSGGEIISWDVANTNSGAVNCPNVDIDLLTFAPGYASYSVTSLATGEVNDGGAIVNFFPQEALSSSLARFRVKCSNNIFYDISDADLVIQGTGLPTDLYSTGDNQTFFNTNGQVFSTSAGNCSVATPPPPSGGGGGTISIPWILYLLGLAYRVRFTRRRMV